MNPFYRDYADFLADVFGPGKVQKISIDAGHSCPNRDGTTGRGGCIYCNNTAFSPGYTARDRGGDIVRQIDRGRQFFAGKYPSMRYLAYFQSYTSTHGDDTDSLMAMYDTAAAQPGVAGIVIATRPDCMPDDLLERLAQLNRRLPVIVEYGVETSHDMTLAAINRCHTWAQAEDAITRTAAAGLRVGVHLIMGLPGETTAMMMQTVARINALPVSTVKFHQLQVVKGTALAAMMADGRMTAGSPEKGGITLFTVEQYLDLCVMLVDALRPDIAIDRFTAQSPGALLVAPRWGLKNHEFTDLLHKRLRRID